MSVQLDIEDTAQSGSLPLVNKKIGALGGVTIKTLLAATADLAASDLLLVSGSPPTVYCNGLWQNLSPINLSPADVHGALENMLSPEQMNAFEANRDLDLAFNLEGHGRYRVNVHYQRGEPAVAIRAIPTAIPAFETLGLPAKVLSFADYPSGLVLITGGTGQGKSTTLASIIHHMNQHRRAHVITIEDPIEFDFQNGACLIEQREVGQDTPSFASALRHILRQRPDVILIGEMRDLETISTALTAAETGHLVLASLHTASASQTIARIIDVFPSAQQSQVRVQLAASLRAILCQQLIRDAGGAGLVAASELLVSTTAIRRAIRENETHLIYSMIETGRVEGMQTMEQSLSGLVRSGRISADSALAATWNTGRLEKLLGSNIPDLYTDKSVRTTGDPLNADVPWA